MVFNADFVTIDGCIVQKKKAAKLAFSLGKFIQLKQNASKKRPNSVWFNPQPVKIGLSLHIKNITRDNKKQKIES